MQSVIIAIHLVIVAIMIGVILLQKSEGGGLGIGGGGGGGFLSSRGTANVLTRATAILAATFFATSLVLSILAGLDRKPHSVIRNTGAPAQQEQAPGAPPARAAACSIRCAGRSSPRHPHRAAGAPLAIGGGSRGRETGLSAF